MFNPKRLIDFASNPQEHIWITATLIKESPKAIKILFDGKEIWLPKAWILHIKRNRHSRSVSINITLSYWKKRG